jgi:hypothetical protein
MGSQDEARRAHPALECPCRYERFDNRIIVGQPLDRRNRVVVRRRNGEQAR